MEKFNSKKSLEFPIFYRSLFAHKSRDLFKSDAVRINLVMNDDKLSLSEAFRIKRKSMDIGVNIESVLINKSQTNTFPDDVRNEFSRQTITRFPLPSKSILGYEALISYIHENNVIFLKPCKDLAKTIRKVLDERFVRALIKAFYHKRGASWTSE